MSVLVPVFLAALALLDGALAGFRAATGRSALIRKRRYNLSAGLRGVRYAGAVLCVLAASLLIYLLTSRDQPAAFAQLSAAGSRMTAVYLPYAVLVLLSMVGYFALPLRASSWTILVGLGPLTLLRPLVAVAGGVAAVWHSRGAAVPIAATCAVVGILAVEPTVHRRWYRQPQ